MCPRWLHNRPGRLSDRCLGLAKFRVATPAATHVKLAPATSYGMEVLAPMDAEIYELGVLRG